MLPIFASAQPTGTNDYNSDYNKNRRDAQKEYEKQADRNRQPNAPANRNTSLSKSDLLEIETWWNNRNVYTKPKIAATEIDWDAQGAFDYNVAELKRIESIVLKFKNELDIFLPNIINSSMLCQSGDCQSGLGFSENAIFNLSANYLKGKKNGIATYYLKNGPIKNINVTYENDFLSGIATIVYPDKTEFALNFTKNKITGLATIYYPNQEKINMHFNKGVISGRLSHIVNSKYYSQYVYRDNKAFATVRSISANGVYYPTYGMYSNDIQYLFKGEYKKFEKEGDGSFYIGQRKNNLRHGMGSYVWGNSTSCYGNWGKGQFTGDGIYYYANGDIYKGNFKNYKRNGFGILEYDNGNTYSGNWKDDKPSGKGKFEYADGSNYEGDFRDYKFNGTGTMIYADGWKYVGSWENGERNGKGTLIRKDGFYSKGSFNKNIEDQVKYYSSNNEEILKSAFDGNPENGFAKKMFDNGDIYEGNWLNGKYHGEGKMKYGDGNEFKGEFFAGNRKFGLVTWSNGNTYYGEFKNNEATGKTKFTWANGDYYIGEFKDWQKSGFGIIYYSDNIVFYEGTFINDLQSGKGKAYYKDSQETYEGDWLNGKFNGTGKVTKKNGFYKIGTYKDFNVLSMKYYSPNGKEITLEEYNK